MDHLMQVTHPGIMAHPSLILWTIITILNILGIDIFSGAQKILAFTMLISLTVIGLYGIGYDDAKGIPMPGIISGFESINGNLFSLIMLAVWPLVGLEMASTLAEETKNPRKNIPAGLFMALGILFIAYFIFTFAAIKVMPAKQLAESDIPHYFFAQAVFGKGGKIAILIIGITTTAVGMNGVIAAQSRLLFGMGHHHQLPAIFKSLHPKFRTPWVGLVTIYIIQAATLLLFGDMPGFILVMIISASSAFLMIYIIAHIDVIILRFKYAGFKRPFKTPLYPLPQIVGIAGMIYALIYNSPSPDLAKKVYTNSAIMVGAAVTYAFFRVKFNMKKELFEAEPIDQAIAD
jgi:amino acid transporter